MSVKGFNRREFLKYSSLALAGGYAGLKTTQAAAGMMGDSSPAERDAGRQ